MASLSQCSTPMDDPAATSSATWPTGMVSQGLLLAQLLVLLLVLHTLRRILSLLGKRLDTLEPQGTPPVSVASPPPSPPRRPRELMPTIETLETERCKPNWSPAVEWAPLTEEELEVIADVRAWLGAAAFNSVGNDQLVCFVRGFAYRQDWARATTAFLAAWLDHRRDFVDGCLLEGATLPPQRELFEELWPSGPIGADHDGHPVVLERPCATTPDRVMTAFDNDMAIKHMTYNREAQRALLNAASARNPSKRLYKAITVLDLAGLSLAHADKGMVDRIRKCNSLFAYAYPESCCKIYVINAPMVFSIVFSVLKTFLHPITVAKLSVCGANYMKVFAADGITLDGGAQEVPKTPPSWTEVVERLRREHPGHVLARGVMLPEDEPVLKARGLRSFD